jgi:hypothetical protein
MKIMIVGAWAWLQYEDAFAKGLRDNGVEVSALSVSSFFKVFLGAFSKLFRFMGLPYGA